MTKPKPWQMKLGYWILDNLKIITLLLGILLIGIIHYQASPECPQCEKKNRIGADYCDKCGSPISDLAKKLKEKGE